MSVYLVALTEPDANAWKAIEKRYRDSSYRVSDTLAFVVVEGVSTATTVRNAVGIDVSQSAPGRNRSQTLTKPICRGVASYSGGLDQGGRRMSNGKRNPDNGGTRVAFPSDEKKLIGEATSTEADPGRQEQRTSSNVDVEIAKVNGRLDVLDTKLDGKFADPPR